MTVDNLSSYFFPSSVGSTLAGLVKLGDTEKLALGQWTGNASGEEFCLMPNLLNHSRYAKSVMMNYLKKVIVAPPNLFYGPTQKWKRLSQKGVESLRNPF